MSLVSAIRRMIDSGLTIEQALKAAEAVEATMQAAQQNNSNDARRARNARYYQARKDRLNSSESDLNKTTKTQIKTVKTLATEIKTPENSPKVSPQEIYNQPPILTPSSSLRSDCASEDLLGVIDIPKAKKPKVSDSSILETLETCLTPEKARELIDHRKAKRSPMSLPAARLLVAAFNEFGNPAAAVDEMILRGWTGFRVDWMKNSQPRAGPELKPAGRNALADAFLMRKPNERNHKPQNGIVDITPTHEGSSPACWPPGNGS